MTLDEQINAYLELATKKDEIEAQMATLREGIIGNMGDEKTHSTGSAVATLVARETIKYPDEHAVVEILKAKGLTQYVVEKVVTTALNKEIKKGGTLTEALNGLYTTTSSYNLVVKEPNE